MPLKEVANEDLQISFTMTAGPPDKLGGLDQGLDPIKITTTLSNNCKAVSKKIATQTITLAFTAANPCPWTSATYTFVAGNGSITATAAKVKADGQFVLRKDDTGSCVGTPVAGGWTLTAPPKTAIPCACTIKISNAGQTKVKAQ